MTNLEVTQKIIELHVQSFIGDSKNACAGYLENYKTDIAHDVQAVYERNQPDKPFGYVVRKSGTHFLEPSKMAAKEVERIFDGEHLYFMFDGSKFVQFSSAKELDYALCGL